jgi:hypothetical protein
MKETLDAKEVQNRDEVAKNIRHNPRLLLDVRHSQPVQEHETTNFDQMRVLQVVIG